VSSRKVGEIHDEIRRIQVEPGASAQRSECRALPGEDVRREQAYGVSMREELVIDLRRTQLLAVDTSLDDARRALVRAARIPSSFAAELRALLVVVADLERRVLAETET
jgi:hypothetical protein